MNKRHLKFKMETGYWPTQDIENCEIDFEQAYKYIQWLEEQIETNEKNKDQTSKHYHDRNRNR